MKVGHNLDLKISKWYFILQNVCYYEFDAFSESNNR